MTNKEKKRNAAKKAAGSKKVYEQDMQSRRISFADYGCMNAQTRVIPDKKKQAKKQECRGKSWKF